MVAAAPVPHTSSYVEISADSLLRRLTSAASIRTGPSDLERPRHGPSADVGGSRLVILGVLIHAPRIVHRGSGEDVSRGHDRGHHRVILVVVLVHAVAPA